MVTGHESINELADRARGGRSLEHKLWLRLGSRAIEVGSNSRELIAELSAYYNGFTMEGPPAAADVVVEAWQGPELETGLAFELKKPDAGKTKVKEEFAGLPGGRVVRKRLTGMLFVFGKGVHLALGPCRENSNQVVNFINNRLIQLELDSGCLLAHAAGVNHRDRGLALAGFSGMGKSTLALHMMSLGLDFVSNDRLLVRRGGSGVKMTGVPKLPRINPGTALNNPDLATVIPDDEREQFAGLATDQIWGLEHKYDVNIDQCFGPGRFRLSSPMHALAVLNWSRAEKTLFINEVDISQRLDLLSAFKKAPGLFFLPNGDEPDFSDQAYLEALSGVRVLELSGGVDFQKAADQCLTLLKGL